MIVPRDPAVPLAQYIEEISCAQTQARLKYFFQHIESYLNDIRISWNFAAPVPEIRVEHEDTLNATANPYVIYITTGLINYFLNLKAAPLDSVLEFSLPEGAFDQNQIGMTALRWILAHEYYHLGRNHDSIGKESDSNTTSHALESDADMCALSAIYRSYQNFYKDIIENDIQIKQLVMYSLFWGLRSLPDDNINNDHPPLALRLYLILNKLLCLMPKPEVPTETMMLEQARKCQVPVLTTLLRCDHQFLITYPSDAINLKQEICQIIDEGKFLPITTRWDALAQQFAHLL